MKEKLLIKAKSIISKQCVPLTMFVLFFIIGIIIGYFRGINYFYLFTVLGFFEFNTRIFMDWYPKARQTIRLIIQFIIGGSLFFWLGLYFGVNFQFAQIFFDFYNVAITGAVIQVVVSRLILPFFFGNGFCSRACWTGLCFELTNKKNRSKFVMKRNNVLAFGYMFLLIIISVYVFFIWEPIQDDNFRRSWIIIENIIIVSMGFVLTFFVGSRAYCRLLCPFLTISSFIAPYSLFKIKPVNNNSCIACKKCDKACPMLINVSDYVLSNKKIDNKLCIVCERCVSACDLNVLKLTR